MRKNMILMLILSMITIGLLACSNSVEPESEDALTNKDEIEIVESGQDHDYSGDYDWDVSQEIQITLNANNITIDGPGAVSDGSKLTITAAGTYRLTGTLEDGQIIVNSSDKEIVRLVLDGVDISCSASAPIYIIDADKAMIVMADDTENSITDGSTYILADTESGEPNAAIFSKSDLTMYGNGKLSVDANYKDGIAGKDGLIIASGNININSNDDGIRGKDYLIIKDGNITVDADGAGLKSTNTNDASLGYITIENGVINIKADENAIDAEKDVTITSGEINLSAKEYGIDAAISATINGGTIEIDSDGDAVHSNGFLTIQDGSLVISSNDDGIHADDDLVINDGDINIIKSYEGIESAQGDITINGGEIHLVSSDDGINIAAGGDSGPWQNSNTGSNYLNIHGGYISINASGDGIDSNSSVVMTGGDLIVSGSSATNNGALDYNGSFAMNGGFMVAAGSYSRMTQAVSTTSEQNSILINFSSAQSAGKIIHIETEAGQEVLTYSPAKSYQSVAFSSPLLTTGTSYTIYLGGSSTGTVVDGIYTKGEFSGGSVYKTFTLSSKVTTIN